MAISEETLRIGYKNYLSEKTQTIQSVSSVICLIISGFLAYSVYDRVEKNYLTAVGWFFIPLIILNLIAEIPIIIYKKTACLSYEKWSKEYLARQNSMQSYNQNNNQYSAQNRYTDETLSHEIKAKISELNNKSTKYNIESQQVSELSYYEIQAKISELQNKIDINNIINRNLPLLEQLTQQKWIIENQMQIIDMEIKKIPLYQQQRENQVFNYLMTQKSNKSIERQNLQSQLDRLQSR